MLTVKKARFPDGNEIRANSIAQTEPVVMTKIVKLNLWVLSSKVLAVKDPITPAIMYMPPNSELFDAEYPNLDVNDATIAESAV